MNRHNKKRNVGIMYELILRHISSKLIEGDKKNAKKATNLLEKRFGKNTELYREFRLFNALIKTSVDSTEIAAAILTESKHAARRLNSKNLKKEKSDLIREINYVIKDKQFYYRTIPTYRQYANIQNMIYEWQKGDNSDLKKMVELEQKALDYLMEAKDCKTLASISSDLDKSDSNVLTQKIMTQKINEKYSGMTYDQKEILKAYALYGKEGEDQDTLVKFLKEKKNNALDTLVSFNSQNDNKYIEGKIKLVESKINELDIADLNDTTIVRFLTLTELVREIKSGE